jgi:hypothetical protein
MPQEYADYAISIIAEAIQNVAYALDNAAVAILYNIPAGGAEPDRYLERVGRMNQNLRRALTLIADNITQPTGAKAKARPRQARVGSPSENSANSGRRKEQDHA